MAIRLFSRQALGRAGTLSMPGHSWRNPSQLCRGGARHYWSSPCKGLGSLRETTKLCEEMQSSPG